MSGREERLKLVSKIINGKIGKADVAKELERISNQYGDDCFNSYEVNRQPKPWSGRNLEELEILSASGAASKDFYLYMAEVSEEVYSKKNKKKKWIQGTMIVALVVIVLVVVVCVFRNNS